ncbi:hypothetical protein [Campylobacter rectus]|uniref:hypothetical protein n=1 Tax=Campylobacter rectus TaxID=203 RepID=UPI0021AB450A|nr:hypothetical protein [Campylobacter rectus]
MAKFELAGLKNLKILHEKQINCVKTGSPGRIFDAFAAVILGLDARLRGRDGNEHRRFMMQI